MAPLAEGLTVWRLFSAAILSALLPLNLAVHLASQYGTALNLTIQTSLMDGLLVSELRARALSNAGLEQKRNRLFLISLHLAAAKDLAY